MLVKSKSLSSVALQSSSSGSTSKRHKKVKEQQEDSRDDHRNPVGQMERADSEPFIADHDGRSGSPKPIKMRRRIDGGYVLVENLLPGLYWHEVKDFMKLAGDVIFVDMVDSDDGRCRGTAVVKFRSRDDATNAVEKLDGIIFRGQKLQVSHHQLKKVTAELNMDLYMGRQLLVKNLGLSVSWQDLRNLFEQCGVIDKTFVFRDENGRSRGVGIVCFDKKEDMMAAYDHFQGYELNGSKIVLEEDFDIEPLKAWQRVRNPHPSQVSLDGSSSSLSHPPPPPPPPSQQGSQRQRYTPYERQHYRSRNVSSAPSGIERRRFVAPEAYYEYPPVPSMYPGEYMTYPYAPRMRYAPPPPPPPGTSMGSPGEAYQQGMPPHPPHMDPYYYDRYYEDMYYGYY